MRARKDSREAVEKTVRDIKRKTRRHFGAEDKIRIVLQGLRGEESIAEICRREGLPAMADRLHLHQDHRLGVVLSLDGDG